MKNPGRHTIALLSALFAVTALDRLVAFLDLGYSESRGRPNELRRVERLEFSLDVQLNPLGFRDPRLPSTKPPGTVRIVRSGTRSRRATVSRKISPGRGVSRFSSTRGTRGRMKW